MNLLNWYNKNYKKLLILPLILVILSLCYMVYFYNQNGDFLMRDVSLKGGTSITLPTEIPASDFKNKLGEILGEVEVRSLTDNSGKQTHLILISSENKEKIIEAVDLAFSIKITEENSSIEFTEGNLGNEFYKQLMTSVFFAFLLMALVVFITFGKSKIIKVYSTILTLISMKLTFPTIGQISFFVILGILFSFFYGLFVSKSPRDKLILILLLISSSVIYLFPFYSLIFLVCAICLMLYSFYSAPSIAVLTAVFADILFTLVTVNILGIKLSSGGIIAFLMLIGYSVGTDVLLTSRVLRRRNESVNSACLGAFKTGIMLTLTAIASILAGLLFVYRFETVLNQIFLIILIGLAYDIFNTWFTNVLIIKWYAESRDKKSGESFK